MSNFAEGLLGKGAYREGRHDPHSAAELHESSSETGGSKRRSSAGVGPRYRSLPSLASTPEAESRTARAAQALSVDLMIGEYRRFSLLWLGAGNQWYHRGAEPI